MQKRLYTFMNYYLSSLQQGLQTAHIVSNLYSKYEKPLNPESNESILYYALHKWGLIDKTIIICNGGNSKTIKELYDFFDSNKDLNLPYTYFSEDEQSLNNAITGTGVIVPENLYDAIYNQNMDCYEYKDEIYPSYSVEYKFIQKIKSYSLAK